MRLYCSTSSPGYVLQRGFDDANTVWLTDIPVPFGEMTLCIDVPDELIADAEVASDLDLGYREFVFEANVVNQFPIHVVEDNDAEALAAPLLAKLRQGDEANGPIEFSPTKGNSQ